MWTDRILHDGESREGWKAARLPVVGASDAAKFAKLASVDLYTRAKLKASSFHGTEYTESGHRWEPMILAYAGIPGNKALIHSPDEVGFACTPDGITSDGSRIAEAKAKHNKQVDGPSPGEWRQLAWQTLCIPEAEHVDFVWLELVRDVAGGWVMRGRGPQLMTIHRDDPRLADRRAALVPIATEVLARLRAARAFEREVSNV
ncbi:hypothetical protein [Pseudoclavibacter helvolus]|uniref:hypothetical protein n=1 Tax=Pseudoclavibacter helvolus TaxID=255205 RepID=UPI0035E6A0DD